MKLEIISICDEKKCTYELKVEGKKSEVLSKTALRIRLGNIINEMGKEE